MDGTGELFERFVAVAPPGYRLIPVRLPEKAEYDELEAVLLDRLPGGDFMIVAESFSGPLGIRLAARAADRVQALIFSNAFARAPRRPIIAMIPWAFLFRFSPPRWVLRSFLLGRFHSEENLVALQKARVQVSPALMTRRLKATLRVNDLAILENLSLPMLYLRGTEDHLVFDHSVEEMQRANPLIIRGNIAAPHLLLQTVAEDAWLRIETFIKMMPNEKGGR